ncbi:MAG TPA: hypothetical protein VJS67_06060 [Pseudonocardiaceae bacterium]|nr:hypothetical protein [Pseudonocardiaceae bacterium]
MSFLAAPAFAAAMMQRQVLATIPVGREVLLLAEGVGPIRLRTRWNGRVRRCTFPARLD